MIPVLDHLFTCVARKWHNIPPEDKEAIEALKGYDSFPAWALPLKRKYDERGSGEALGCCGKIRTRQG